jgi:hypothetical protein
MCRAGRAREAEAVVLAALAFLVLIFTCGEGAGNPFEAKEKPPIGIPLRGPRARVVLAWLAAVLVSGAGERALSESGDGCCGVII